MEMQGRITRYIDGRLEGGGKDIPELHIVIYSVRRQPIPISLDLPPLRSFMGPELARRVFRVRV